jgi:hypothetical protein
MSDYDSWDAQDDACLGRADELTRQAAHAVIKRSAMLIAASMIHGGYEERDRAYSAAHDVQREVGGFVELVKRSIRMLDQDPQRVWREPSESAGGPAPAAGGLHAKEAESLRYALARHIAGAYVSGGDDQVRRAKELETSLDGLGLNVDNLVDRQVIEAMRDLPSNRGRGGRADNCPF